MSKKILFSLGLLVVLSVAVIIFKSQPQKKTISPLLEKKAIPTKTITKKLKEYSDASGFKFSYPEDLKIAVNDISASNTLYADLALTSPSKRGSLTIKVSDITKTFFDEFLKGKTTIETKLADLPAYQYQEKKKLVTTAYDQGVQFTLTADLSQEKNYWFNINKQIINLFKFVQPETPAASSGGGSEDSVIFEGEETIE